MRRATSSWSMVGGTVMMFVRITSAIALLGLGAMSSSRRLDDARELLLVDDVDDVDELARARARAAARSPSASDTRDARRDRDVVRRHQVAGARLRPLLDLADFLGGLGVDLLERLEELLAHRLGQHAEEVGAVVGRHLAGDLGHRLRRHLLDELFLLVLVEALEDGRRVLGGHPREQLAGLVGLELADDVGEVLGVDLVEQLAHLAPDPP